MNLRLLTRWVLILGPALLLSMAAPRQALAQCGSCAPPPSCNCAPPTPPSPPPSPCCGSGGHQVRVPGVNVNVAASVIVNANVAANVSAAAAGSGAGAVFVGGGGGGGGVSPGVVSVISGLNVVQGGERSGFQASRTKVRIVVIQAVCLDDRAIPHPASQVSPEREIGADYEGELYRCIAGTHMQVTYADFAGTISFDHGQIMTCQKNEALYYSGAGGQSRMPGAPDAGRMECRPQKPARDCNERSLLRRYGAGMKIIKIITTESYTAYREETSASSSMSSMTVDGGVGGVVY